MYIRRPWVRGFQGRTTDGYEANRWTDGEADRGAAVFLAVASDADAMGADTWGAVADGGGRGPGRGRERHGKAA